MKLLSEYIAELNTLLKAEGDLPIAFMDRDEEMTAADSSISPCVVKGSKVSDHDGSVKNFVLI